MPSLGSSGLVFLLLLPTKAEPTPSAAALAKAVAELLTVIAEFDGAEADDSIDMVAAADPDAAAAALLVGTRDDGGRDDEAGR